MSTIESGASEGLFAVDKLIETAYATAGVGDPTILDTPGLRALSYSLECSNERVNFIGRNRAQKMLLETLVKHLRVDHHLTQHPEIRDIEFQTPIFLVAPFRSGTTLLHRLLAQDPAHRTPRLWEALQAPPVETDYQGSSEYFQKDPRIAIAQKYIKARELFTPDIAAMHPTSVDAPEECFGLLETSMLSHSFTFYAPVMEYLDWLDQRSNDEWKASYALYADQLRLLMWWSPAQRWVLKTPFHMWAVDAVCANFPNALVVQQHREPETCIASYCSLITAAYGPIGAKLDGQIIGQIALRYLKDALARNVAARNQLDSKQFIDIDYKELISDPIGSVRRVYAAIDQPFTPDLEQQVKSWMEEQSGHRKGNPHKYSLKDYGLDLDEVNEAFAQYRAFCN
ncbi:MAG TPA: sulfotransferase [Chromatiaceae bacterium]|jgi:hypothetical protein|nr:sulfotransferase [Chromatiaceae bacterium]HIN82469.1 sulfotransferase [Chromatiales bacterium]HIA07953.1 sulfotransferase [Chromatiaceae bacterium]HIB85196.1 sulfotransferase [Chromatiaceae bacterium]HIO15052.1 sulfotransferase [Chromatiales bacterium]